MPAEPRSPADLYRSRLGARKAELATLERRHARLGYVRLALAAASLATIWWCANPERAAPAWLLLPGTAFIAAILYDSRVRRLLARARSVTAFYEDGLARLEDRWRGRGRDGRRFEDPHHVYAADLDLFGPGNLYELLCAARTPMGEARLAAWLLSPTTAEIIRGRHRATEELRHRVDLREAWATVGDAKPVELHPERLVAWAAAPNRLQGLWIRPLALTLTAAALGSALWWSWQGVASPFLGVVLAEVALLYVLRAPIREATAAVETAYEDLKNLRALLERIETEAFAAPALAALSAALQSRALPASATLARLATVVNWVESRRNPLLAPLMAVVLYPLHTALAAERWRREHGAVIAAWLEALGEMEALLSLSRYAYEHPAFAWPAIAQGEATFRAKGLAHPLIASASRISNDVELSPPVRVLLVSGSNMSGKSTLLRTVGINTVLAMAGAPVCARELELTRLRVGASIRINDSLHEGSSRFYAEITRLRRLLEPAEGPLLFLLDELLQGTNSADRLVGAQGIVKGLIERGNIGLVSTHDLALQEIPALPVGALVNVHFEDQFRDGTLSFDYRLRPGVVTRSNGVELMRSVGLDV